MGQQHIEQPVLVYSVKEIAQILKIGKNGAYELVRTGKLQGIHIGRQIRISRAELARYLQVTQEAM